MACMHLCVDSVVDLRMYLYIYIYVYVFVYLFIYIVLLIHLCMCLFCSYPGVASAGFSPVERAD